MADDKTTEQPEFQSDTSGNKPLSGTVHVMEQKMQSGAATNKALAGSTENKSLSRMTKAELEATASAEGVDLSSASNNAERVALIEKARS